VSESDAYRESNRHLWNAWTPYHVGSAFYDVEGFKAGRPPSGTALDALEADLVGDVAGASLLHLQCHFGLDTLRWARRGAMVTGVDFAEAAIEAARALAAETAIRATFVLSDVYDLPERLQGQFDVVFTSHGVLGWLPDLERWGRVIAHFLKPGGRLCLIEAHPVALLFDEGRTDRELRLLYPYFGGPEPIRTEQVGSYAVPDAPVRGVEYLWLHPLSAVLGALLRAGLRIDSFAEYPHAAWAIFPWMERGADGVWRLPDGAGSLPLMFSVTATKRG
jgi:SAM-dependent methyltransferase